MEGKEKGKEKELHGLFRAVLTQKAVVEKRLEPIAQGYVKSNTAAGIYFEDGSFVPHTAYDVCLPITIEKPEEPKPEKQDAKK